MRGLWIFLPFILFSCASRPKRASCLEATEKWKVSSSTAKGILGRISHLLSEADVTPEKDVQETKTLWRFKKVPVESLFAKLGLKEGDGLYRTNLGPLEHSMNLTSDLAGVAFGTTKCLYVKGKDGVSKVVELEVKKPSS